MISLKSRSTGSNTETGTDSAEDEELLLLEQEIINSEKSTEMKKNLIISLDANWDFVIMKYRLVPVEKESQF